MEKPDRWAKVETSVWKPKSDGDSITGIYKSKDQGNEDVGNKYYLEADTEDGIKTMFFWGSSILDDLMQGVKIGDLIRVTFKGKKKLEKGKTLNLYDVERYQGH